MEALSPTMEEGQLVRWLKGEGDDVSNGDILAEIETDKATMELVARGAGVLRKIFLEEGGTAAVGAVIGVIADADEDISGVEGVSGGGGGAAPVAAAQDAGAPDEGKDDEAPSESGSEAAETPAPTLQPSTGSTGRVKASPVARRLAEDAGIDLGRVQGSGPGGRVVKRDVEEAKDKGVSGAGLAHSGPEYEDLPVSQMRKAIAKRLVQSIGPVPTFYLTIDVDMGRMLDARKRINAMLEAQGQKVSINDLVLKATAAALARHPECNAQWRDGFIRRYNAVHLGVAVAIDDGLITPIVRNAHLKGVAAIGKEVRELAGRAREKKLQPDEYTGATFSVSNLGMFGIKQFRAIINPPESAILTVGTVVRKPVVINEEDEIAVRPILNLTLSADHRVVDGVVAANFLADLVQALENPDLLLY